MITEPFAIADDTFVIQSWHQAPGAEVGVNINTMLTRGPEPVVFDTGVGPDGDAWIETIGSLVDWSDVKYIVLSHDDHDHVGNVLRALDLAPDATVISTFFMNERIAEDVPVPPTRQRWVADGEVLHLEDRTLSFVRPPLFDSPVTRVVHDSKTGVLWGGDLTASLTDVSYADAADVPADFLQDQFLAAQQMISPWFAMLDGDKFQAEVDKLQRYDIKAIASTHAPAYRGAMVDRAFEMLRQVPDAITPPAPGQELLDEIISMIVNGPEAAAA
jgi:flavorubredoxin